MTRHIRPRITEEPISPRALVRASRIFCRAVRELYPPIDADAALAKTVFADAKPFDPEQFVNDIVGS